MKWPINKIDYPHREAILSRVRADSTPDNGYYFLLILSVIITTFGLILNSGAVIIGGMIIAPLLNPIIGIGVSVVKGEERWLTNLLALVLKSILISTAVAALITIISPLREPTKEILSRTEPNLIDLIIALASGAAGAYAVSARERLISLMGVAVAAALVPPLAVVGYAIATGSFDLAGGALLLFLANLFAVIVATVIVFYMLGFSPGRKEETRHLARRDFAISAVIFISITIVLSVFLFNTIRSAQRVQTIEDEVHTFLNNYDDLELISVDESQTITGKKLKLTMRGPANLTKRAVSILDSQIENRLGEAIDLQIILIPATKILDE